MADDFDEELTVVDLLESVISNSAQQKEAIAKHIQSILLVKHLQPVSGTSQSTLLLSLNIIMRRLCLDSSMTTLLHLLLKTQRSPLDIKIVYQRKKNKGHTHIFA